MQVLGLILLVVSLTVDGQELNNRPIIGILSQQLGRSMRKVESLSSNYDSYIAASYVKYIEMAGARVVPILIGQNESYYDDILGKINGVVFPGGGASIKSGPYHEAGKKIFNYITSPERTSDIPLWATCLGFEMLLLLAGNKNPLTPCAASNRADPLFFTPESNRTQLVSEMPSEIYSYLENMNVTSNFHKYCITNETFYEHGLDQQFHIISTNLDDNGLEYISTVEHLELPIYGSQWHPEKNSFEWANRKTTNSIPHGIEAIKVGQHFANFFVDKARMNNQTFPSEKEEEEELIYNYNPTFVAPLYPSSFQQCYFF
ncbi:gamma-glutamyl hydrolase-like [Oratosquilla oratoria]|uniref:gamma-glutamyl hydrolase-like n=1 Tax=Oratosquilla oratoria TaxID=337810 RepID=UPI003F75B2B9